jgi:hypothetical protein
MDARDEHPRVLTPATRLSHTLNWTASCAPPRFESEFSDEVIAAWRAQGHLDGRSPEEFFGLDRRETLPVDWDRRGQRFVVEDERGLAEFARAYNADDPERLPSDWSQLVPTWRARDFVLDAETWDEGFFQILGIADGASLNNALIQLCERPELVGAQMEHYAEFLVRMLDRVLADVSLDYVVFYEPIASNHGPVISAEMYQRFVGKALRRVCDSLERHGVTQRIVWTAGRVDSLIGVWLDHGITGLILNQANQCGLPFVELRKRFGPAPRLFGGIDWRAVVRGPASIDDFLEHEVRPLLEQGGYVPYLDDTVRVYMPFDHFRYYRAKLDALLDTYDK